LHKLTAGPSKAKNWGLARMVLGLAFLLLPIFQAWGADILIDSGEQRDTVMQVGPGVGDGQENRNIRIESDPDNGTLIQVTPPPSYYQNESDIGPIIVTPEIRLKE